MKKYIASTRLYPMGFAFIVGTMLAGKVFSVESTGQRKEIVGHHGKSKESKEENASYSVLKLISLVMNMPLRDFKNKTPNFIEKKKEISKESILFLIKHKSVCNNDEYLKILENDVIEYANKIQNDKKFKEFQRNILFLRDAIAQYQCRINSRGESELGKQSNQKIQIVSQEEHNFLKQTKIANALAAEKVGDKIGVNAALNILKNEYNKMDLLFILNSRVDDMLKTMEESSSLVKKVKMSKKAFCLIQDINSLKNQVDSLEEELGAMSEEDGFKKVFEKSRESCELNNRVELFANKVILKIPCADQ